MRRVLEASFPNCSPKLYVEGTTEEFEHRWHCKPTPGSTLLLDRRGDEVAATQTSTKYVKEVPLSSVAIAVSQKEYADVETALLQHIAWVGEKSGQRWTPPFSYWPNRPGYLCIQEAGITWSNTPSNPNWVLDPWYFLRVVDRLLGSECAPPVGGEWNAVCPDCGAPAYIGFTQLECSAPTCTRYRRQQ